MQYYENSQTVGSASCSYKNLNNYNGREPGMMNLPVPPTTTSGYYVVPAWNPRVSLTKGGCPSCSGYPSIQGAYGKNADKCSPKYQEMPCNKGVGY